MSSTDTKKCPSCRVPMDVVVSKQIYGQHLELDQCSRCGNVWFDDLEIYKTHPEFISDLAHMDVVAFVSLAAANDQSTFCPKDDALLIPYKNHKLPDTMQLSTCPQCSGVWGHYVAAQDFIRKRDELRRDVYAKDKTAGNLALESYLKKLAEEDRIDEILDFTDIHHGKTVQLPSEAQRKTWGELTREEKKVALQNMVFQIAGRNPIIAILVVGLIELLVFSMQLRENEEVESNQ